MYILYICTDFYYHFVISALSTRGFKNIEAKKPTLIDLVMSKSDLTSYIDFIMDSSRLDDA